MAGKDFSLRVFRADLRALEREVALSMAADGDCCGVSLARCHLLLEAQARGSTSVTDLAAVLELDKSTLSRTVDGMCRAGLLARRTDPSNRRQQIIRLTRKGESSAEAINAACDASYARLLDFIPAGRRAVVVEAVALLSAAMRCKRKEQDPACCADQKSG